MKQKFVLMLLQLNHYEADAAVECPMMMMLMMGQTPLLVQPMRMGAGETVQQTLLSQMLILSPNASHQLLVERFVYLDLKSQTSGHQLPMNIS